LNYICLKTVQCFESILDGTQACLTYDVIMNAMVSEFLMDPDGNEKFLLSLEMFYPDMAAVVISKALPIKRKLILNTYKRKSDSST